MRISMISQQLNYNYDGGLKPTGDASMQLGQVACSLQVRDQGTHYIEVELEWWPYTLCHMQYAFYPTLYN